MNRDDRILITGYGGLVGTALDSTLRSNGFHKTVRVCSPYRGLAGHDLEPCNLLIPDDVNYLIRNAKPTHVFHAAARVYGIGGNMANQAKSFYENTMINTNVVDASQRAGVQKITVMGTGAIYPPPNGDEIFLPKYREDGIFDGRPHDSEAGYAHAKRGMLAMLEAYKESYGLDFAYIVSCNLFGPHDKFDTDTGHVVPSLIAKFHEAKNNDEPVRVWGDGSAERDFLYVKDAARVGMLTMDAISGPVNMGSGRVYRIRDIVQGLCSITGHYRIEWDASKPNGQALRGYDLSRLRAHGFTPLYSIERGLAETWEWYGHERAEQ